VVVEGQPEESFVTNIVARFFWPHQINLLPILLGRPGYKGGRTNYARVKRDILMLLKQDRTAYCSTMLDFYGLGQGFPGMPPLEHLTNVEKVLRIEKSVDECPHFRDWLDSLQEIAQS
jgi:hypothetical protein